ncbi:hypothetical protein D3C85_894480 [compost metagenome]
MRLPFISQRLKYLAGVFAKTRRGTPRLPRRAGEPIGRARQREEGATVRVRHIVLEKTAVPELLVDQQIGAGADRADRNAPALALLIEFGLRPAGRVRKEYGLEAFLGLVAGEIGHIAPALLAQCLRARGADIHQPVRGRGPKAIGRDPSGHEVDHAVGAGKHAGARLALQAAIPSAHRVFQVDELHRVLQRHGDAFLHRHIDLLPLSAAVFTAP